MESQFEPHIVSFCCHNCTSCAEDNLESIRKENSITIELRKLPCTGKVDIIYLLKAFEEGADVVYVVGCLEGTCHYLEGNIRTKRRVKFAQKIMDEIGIGGDRVHMYNIDPSKRESFSKVTNEMIKIVKELGPSPLKVQS